MQRRLPKRGFTNIFKKHFALVNLKDLARFSAEQTITPEFLLRTGVVKKLGDGLKVLGDGDVDGIADGGGAGVEIDQHGAPVLRERQREVDGERRLADAALSG